MDQKINDYLEKLISEVLASPMFAGLPADQKDTLAPKVRTYLNGVIIDALVDRLSTEQLNIIKDLPANSPEMEEKIEEYATSIPMLAKDIEERITLSVADIKQNPQIVS